MSSDFPGKIADHGFPDSFRFYNRLYPCHGSMSEVSPPERIFHSTPEQSSMLAEASADRCGMPRYQAWPAVVAWAKILRLRGLLTVAAIRRAVEGRKPHVRRSSTPPESIPEINNPPEVSGESHRASPPETRVTSQLIQEGSKNR